MNTTEDKMKKPPTPSGRGAARIAALERECAGWMDASTRFQRQRNASDAVLADACREIRALAGVARESEPARVDDVEGDL